MIGNRQSGGAAHPGSPRVTRRGMLLAGASAAFLAACGGGGSKEAGQTTNASPGAQSSAQAAASATAAPKPGGTFTWSDRGNAPLDPHNNPTYRANTLAGFVYSRLLKFKTGPKPEAFFNYEVLPDLATGWEFTNNGLQLTFKLRPDAAFHNMPPVSGRALTSEDVAFSLDRFRSAPKNTNRNAFGSKESPLVDKLETPDATTVVVKLAKPYAPILNLFANHQYLWILPKEADSGFDPATRMIGTGPWMLDQVQPDMSITMKKHPNFFVKGQPYIDTVVRAVIPETSQYIAQYQAGRLDFQGIPAQNKDDVQRSNPDSSIITYIPTTYTFLAPQQRGDSVFKDVRIRRAMSMAIDRKAWVDVLYEGQGLHYLNAVPPSMGKWWLDPQGKDAGPGAQYMQFDAKAARDLLTAAGAENMPLRWIFANNAYGDIFNQGAEATATMMKDAGFNPTIVTQDYLREYIDANGTFFGHYDGVFYGLQTPFSDPHDYLFSMNHPRSARNHAGIDDPKLSAMIDDEERTLDENERVKKVHDIQRYWLEQMYYIPVAVGSAYIFIQPWVKRLYYSGSYGWGAESLINAWIDKS